MNQSAKEIPEQLGRYHVLDLAGRGNMAVVYTGFDPYENRDVALKVCDPRDSDSPNHSPAITRKLFYNEARTAAELDHPNILKVLDAGEHEHNLYIVMEYVDGSESLQSLCDRGTPLTPKHAAEIIYTCANALDYAHRNGVVHRDIKPSNILFTPEGDLKIGDFGIAQRASAESTQVSGVLGTPHYMSPEQVRGDAVTGQTDLYSLGIVLYRLLAGRLPFSGDNIPNLLYNVCHREPPDLPSIRTDLPPELIQVVETAMQKDISLRYRFGRDIASDLANIFFELDKPKAAPPDNSRFKLARSLRYFSELSDAQLWEVLHVCRWDTHEAGNKVVEEGTLDMSLFVIMSGTASVNVGGRTVAVLTRGDCFGEMGYFGEPGASAAMTATTDVTVMRINAAGIEQTSTECQLRFHKAFLQVLVERLSRNNKKSVAANVSDPPKKTYPISASEVQDSAIAHSDAGAVNDPEGS